MLRDAYKDIGFTTAEAERRAKILFCFDVGLAQTGAIGKKCGGRALVELLLDGLTEKASK